MGEVVPGEKVLVQRHWLRCEVGIIVGPGVYEGMTQVAIDGNVLSVPTAWLLADTPENAKLLWEAENLARQAKALYGAADDLYKQVEAKRNQMTRWRKQEERSQP